MTLKRILRTVRCVLCSRCVPAQVLTDAKTEEVLTVEAGQRCSHCRAWLDSCGTILPTETTEPSYQ